MSFEAAPLQQARDGEDYAWHMASFLVQPPFHGCVDCKVTFQCLMGPAEYSAAASKQRAHLWGPFWASFEPSDFKASKTKAHTTAQDVERGVTTHWERAANKLADDYAKLGASYHNITDDDRLLHQALTAIAKEAAIWSGRLNAHMSDSGFRDAQGLPGPAAAAVGAASSQEEATEPAAMAESEADRGGDHRQQPQANKPCRHEGHNLLAAEVDPPGHGQVVFCYTCGAYCWKKIGMLQRRCQGPRAPGLKAQRDRLKAGKFPGSGKAWTIGRATPLSEQQEGTLLHKLQQRRRKTATATGLVAPPAQLHRAELLACYGTCEADVPDLVRWAKELEQQKRARAHALTTEISDSDLSDFGDFH